MIRSILGLVVCVIAMATVFAADEPGQEQPDPPVRLKKKKPNVAPGEQPVQEGLKPEDKKSADPKAEEKQPEEKKPDDMGEITKDGEPIDSGEEDKEVFERVARNMKSVEERLVNKELNDGTRQMQEDIIKDLDSLINSGNPQGGGGADQNQDNANEQPQGGDPMGQGQKKSSSQQKKSGKQKGKQGQKGQGQGQQKKNGTKGGNSKEQGKGNPQHQDGQGNKPMGQDKDQGGDNPGGNGNNGGKGGTSKEDPNRDADLYKDAWGHLPETLRAQMDAYSNREKYMDKHQDLIKQYYKSIAAQGQRKKE